ncbi:MAG: family 20 glycosylhydrolase [Spirochaetes bacterium]|jgi:hypothetical protein|nr:family 20 glycosylhydrolase [Spirochaetota bacterium]
MIPAPHTVVDGTGALAAAATPSLEDLNSYRLGNALPARLEDDGAVGFPRTAPASDQAFVLHIRPHGISIAASADSGRLYAVQTLRQLLVLSGSAALPCGRIEDGPALPDRGYMLDVSRNRVASLEYLEELLDLLLLLRYNHLELYLEHTFAYTGHGEVWGGWSPFTPAEMQWLDREAASRGIELVPNQNSFGHMTRWLEHDTYRGLAEAPEGFTDPWGQQRDHPFSLSPAAPGVDDFLAGLYDQLLPNFTSRRFNVGLDETFDLGQGLSASWVDAEARRVASSAGAGAGGARNAAKGRVYLAFLQRVHRLVSERGRRMLFWADIIQNHPELVGDVPQDAVAVEWGYEGDHDFDTRCRRLSAAGLRFLVGPGTCAWNSTGGRLETANANIVAAVKAAEEYGAAGMLLTDWGDNGHIPPPLVSYPAIAVAAAFSWEGTAPETVEGSTVKGSERAFSWLDTFVLGDADGRLAEGLRLLNTLDAHDPRRILNASILGIALLTPNKAVYAGLPEGTPPETLHAMEHQIHRARSILTVATPKNRGGELQKQELLFCADLSLFALDLLRRHSNAPGTQREAGSQHREMMERLERLQSRMSALWLRRSRRGGLADSLSILACGVQHLETVRSGE